MSSSRERFMVPGLLEDGTPVKVWYKGGELQSDWAGQDPEDIVGGEDDYPVVFDLTGKAFPAFIPKDERKRNGEQKFWGSIKVGRDHPWG